MEKINLFLTLFVLLAVGAVLHYQNQQMINCLQEIKQKYIDQETERIRKFDSEMEKINNWYKNHPTINRF